MDTEIRVYICDSESWYSDTPNADIEMVLKSINAVTITATTRFVVLVITFHPFLKHDF